MSSQNIAELVSSLRTSLLCSLCKSFPNNPHNLDCGHNFCFACISKSLFDKNQCPKCQAIACPKDLRRNPFASQLAEKFQSFSTCLELSQPKPEISTALKNDLNKERSAVLTDITNEKDAMIQSKTPKRIVRTNISGNMKNIKTTGYKVRSSPLAEKKSISQINLYDVKGTISIEEGLSLKKESVIFNQDHSIAKRTASSHRDFLKAHSKPKIQRYLATSQHSGNAIGDFFSRSPKREEKSVSENNSNWTPKSIDLETDDNHISKKHLEESNFENFIISASNVPGEFSYSTINDKASLSLSTEIPFCVLDDGPTDYSEAIRLEKVFIDVLIKAKYLSKQDARKSINLGKILFDLLWDGILVGKMQSMEKRLLEKGAPTKLLYDFVESNGLYEKNNNTKSHLSKIQRNYKDWNNKS